MKIAIVHEMLVKKWGAEKVVSELLGIFPKADLYTLIYDEAQVWDAFPKSRIHPKCFSLSSQRIYTLTKKQRFCLPFMYSSAQKLALTSYDLIIISSSGFAHSVARDASIPSIVYCHAPARYLWDWTHEYRKDIGMDRGLRGFIYGAFLKKLRMQDYEAVQKNTLYLANSSTTQSRITKYFRRISEVLYPPIETERFAKTISASEQENIFKHISKQLSESQSPIGRVLRSDMLNIFSQGQYYIILSALTEFKRLDVAIAWFRNLPENNLLIIGQGEYRSELENLSWDAKNIFFVGAQYGDDLVTLVQNSQWLIFPWEEDFGIVPIEVMAAGKPVFALKKWWLTETVIAWKTGDFFSDPEWVDFIESFQDFHQKNINWVYSESTCKTQAQQFDRRVFEERMRGYVEKVVKK